MTCKLTVFASKFCLLVLLVFSGWPLHAQMLFDRHTSVRALGMGNAYIAVVQDSDSLFYNPAGLRRVRGLNWVIFDSQLGANGLKIQDAVDVLTEEGVEIHEALAELYGENYWFHTEFKSLLTLPGWGGGVFGSAGLQFVLENPAYTNLEIAAMADYGLVLGMAVPVVPGFMSAGAVVKRISRMGSNFPLGPSSLAHADSESILDEISRKGVGYSLDLGVNLEVPSPLQPTLSAVWRNAGTTSFRSSDGAPAPIPDKDEISLGAALAIDGPLFTLRPALEYRYSNWTGVQLGKKLHMGVELELPLIDARAGLNQGYYTLGVGADLGFLRVDAATYGVELGVYPGQLEDRRYILQISTKLGFNPSFDFSGSGGQSRTSRIKQRR